MAKYLFGRVAFMLVLSLAFFNSIDGYYNIEESDVNTTNLNTAFKVKKQTYKRFLNTGFNGEWVHVITPKKGKTASVTECAHSCQNTRECCSFFWDNTNTCLINNQPMRSDQMQQQLGTHYYEIQNNCTKNPAICGGVNEGLVCIPNFKNSSYTCV